MDPVLHWHNALSIHPESGREFAREIIDTGLCFDQRPVCTVARPVFVEPNLVVRYARILRGFHEAVRFARKMIIDDGLEGDPDSLAIRLGLSPQVLELAAIPSTDPSASVLARVDTFCRDGHPWIIELNAESPAGMAYGDMLGRLVMTKKELSRGLELSPMWSTPAAVRAILDSYRRFGGHSRVPTVAIVDLKEVATWPEFTWFGREFEKLGIPCVICDPSQLDFDGTHLTFEGRVIDLVYRRILVSDILAHPDRCEALLRAYRSQSVVMVNSLRTTLLHCKGLFALLHDPMVFELLPRLAQEVVQAHIPWTGILSESPGLGAPPEIKEVVRQNREHWVIKPLRGHGGTGVVIGSKVDASTWENAIDTANHHVVQRRIEPPKEEFPITTDEFALRRMVVSLDPYLIRGRLAGFLSRVSENGLGNVHQGSSQAPVLIHGKAPYDYLPDLST